MGKDRGGDSNVQMGIEAHEAEDLPNGETSSDSVISDQAARAFDVLTKALQPQPDQNENAENSMDQSNASGGSQEFDDDKSLVLQYEGPMLTDTNFAFNLTMPAPMPAYLTVHYICETASRLLFLSIHWARNIPAFQLINIELQIQLVQAYWSELFVLGLAQCSLTMNLSTILSAILNHLQTRLLHEKMPSERVKKVIDTVTMLQDFVNRMNQLDVDEPEYAYLKSLVLFSPDKLSASGGRLMESYRDKCGRELYDYASHTDVNRPVDLCLRLPALRLLSPNIVEELFFAGLIGSVELDSIIPYIMRLDAVEFSTLLRGGGIAVSTATTTQQPATATTTLSSSSSSYINSYMQLSAAPVAGVTTQAIVSSAVPNLSHIVVTPTAECRDIEESPQ
jgi:hypothetical protein